MNDFTVPTMLSIRETARKTGLPEHYLRKLCLTNAISYKKAGNKHLINIEKLIAYLNESDS